MTKKEFEELLAQEWHDETIVRDDVVEDGQKMTGIGVNSTKAFTLTEIGTVLKGFRIVEALVESSLAVAETKEDERSKEFATDLRCGQEALQLLREKLLQPMADGILMGILGKERAKTLKNAFNVIADALERCKEDEGKGDEDVQGTD